MAIKITNESVLEHKRLVDNIVNRIYNDDIATVLTRDDLFQAGMIGLMDAMEKFDDSKGAKFETYAYWRIKGSIMDEIRNSDFVPRMTRIESTKYQKEKDRLSMESSSPTSMEDVARSLGIDIVDASKLEKALEINSAFLSLDNVISFDADKTTFHDIVSGLDENEFEERAEKDAILRSLFSEIQKLSIQERITVMRHFFGDKTLKEIGEELGLCTSRTWQIKHKAIKKLRAAMTEILTGQPERTVV